MEELSYVSRSKRQFVIRDMQSNDVELLVDLFYQLSPETIYRRFHTVMNPKTLPVEHVRKMVTKLAQIDPQCEVALLALHNERAVGVARFHQIPHGTEAEAAIVIRDDFHRDGLGTHLLTILRERALAMGITHLVAMVQAQNHPILKVIRRSGLQSHWRTEGGESYLAVDICC